MSFTSIHLPVPLIKCSFFASEFEHKVIATDNFSTPEVQEIEGILGSNKQEIFHKCRLRQSICLFHPKVYENLIMGVYENLIMGVYENLIKGVYENLIKGVYEKLIKGVY